MNNNKLIEAYIQMAKSGGYNTSFLDKFWSRYDIIPPQHESLIRMVTSKEFIEAIARGIYPKEQEDSPGKFGTIHHITTEQAIAIRENNLPEFIQSILPKE